MASEGHCTLPMLLLHVLLGPRCPIEKGRELWELVGQAPARTNPGLLRACCVSSLSDLAVEMYKKRALRMKASIR